MPKSKSLTTKNIEIIIRVKIISFGIYFQKMSQYKTFRFIIDLTLISIHKYKIKRQ